MTWGHIERRLWTPRLSDRGPFEVEVFLPGRLAAELPSFRTPAGVIEAEKALAALRGDRAGGAVAPMLLRAEGIASSRVEGLFLGTRRLFEARHAPETIDDRTAAQVLNNMSVMEDVVRSAGQGITTKIVKSWHAALLGGVVSEAFQPGEWRSVQNWIGGDALSPRRARFIPPPPEVVPELMDDLVAYAGRADSGPLVQAAIAHGQFETIHPFVDGNGRVGRALIYRILAYRGALPAMAPPISPILVERKEEYIAGLERYRSGDFESWIAFFADALLEAVAYTRRLSARLDVVREGWADALAGVRRDALVHRIIEDLAATPVLDRSSVVATYGVSGETSRRALQSLADHGIVEERPLRRARRGRPARAYEAPEVFALLDTPPSQLA
jgi:Fic family protein